MNDIFEYDSHLVEGIIHDLYPDCQIEGYLNFVNVKLGLFAAALKAMGEQAKNEGRLLLIATHYSFKFPGMVIISHPIKTKYHESIAGDSLSK